jgi:hypothetical protein
VRAFAVSLVVEAGRAGGTACLAVPYLDRLIGADACPGSPGALAIESGFGVGKDWPKAKAGAAISATTKLATAAVCRTLFMEAIIAEIVP